MANSWSEYVRSLIRHAIHEDLGEPPLDVTSELLPAAAAAATIRARRPGVCAGMALLPVLAEEIEAALRPAHATALTLAARCRDGTELAAGAALATLSGEQRAVLSAERTILNFLARLCGVATLTRRYVAAARAANPAVEVLDTRKTLPGWRELDKYAVRCGGGTNHRDGLYDAVLLKDNHLAGVPAGELAAWLTALLDRLKRHVKFVEVEVDSLEQLRGVLAVPRVDIVLLDNFEHDALRAAVALRDAESATRRPRLEASGRVSLDTIAEIAATGVDRISVGALTHSAPALDVGLDFD